MQNEDNLFVLVIEQSFFDQDVRIPCIFRGITEIPFYYALEEVEYDAVGPVMDSFHWTPERQSESIYVALQPMAPTESTSSALMAQDKILNQTYPTETPFKKSQHSSSCFPSELISIFDKMESPGPLSTLLTAAVNDSTAMT